MKRGSTLFLKGVVVLLGLGALAVCIFLLPWIASGDAEAHPEDSYLQYPFLVCSYLLSIPFFAALVQTLQLLSCIDRGYAFSESSVRALRTIKRCGITISVFITLGELFVILFIDDDITHIITLGALSIFASSVIASFAALLQKVLRDAIRIKIENDLTV
jgi:O-antigen/teichoic acid export membrane protein